MSQHFTLVVQQVQLGSLDCTFNLRTPFGVQHGRLKSSPELMAACAQWRALYSTYYRDVRSTTRARRAGQGTLTTTALPVPGLSTASQPLPPPSTEAEMAHQRQELQRAERRLRQQFDRWLLQSSFVPVRDLLREQLRHSHSGDFTLSLELAGELQYLPWELWNVLGPDGHSSQRLPRVSRAQPEYCQLAPARRRDESQPVRILAIFGDDFGINLAGDEQALRETVYGEIRFLSLRTLAQSSEAPQPLRPQDMLRAIREALCDPQGWDLLFFAGHSDASENMGGQIAIAPHTTVPFESIAEQFAVACRNGLRVAIFNSCTGVDIARSLIRLGLPQALVMREPIHNELAEVFLKEFLVHFAQGEDLHAANRRACAVLRNCEREYPSVHLIPSVFQHPQVLQETTDPTDLGLGYFKPLVRSFSASQLQIGPGQTVRLQVEPAGASSLELHMGRDRYTWPLQRSEMAFALDHTTHFELIAQHTITVRGESQVVTQRYPLTVEVIQADGQTITAGQRHRETLGQLLEQAQRANQARQFPEALASLEAALRLAPTHGELQMQLGQTLRRVERFDEAAAAFRRAATLLAEDGTKAQAYQELGLVLLEQANGSAELSLLEQAINALTHAIELDPFNAEIRNSLSIARRRREELIQVERTQPRSLRYWSGTAGRPLLLLAVLLGLITTGAGIATLWQYRHFKPGLADLPELQTPANDSAPVLSGDGKRLLWQSGSQTRIYDLAQQQLLDRALPGGSQATVSANWRIEALVTDHSGNPNLVLYNLRQGELLDFPAVGGPNTSATEEQPSLNAEGERLAFTSNRTGNADIYIYDLAGQRPPASTQFPGLNSPKRELGPSLSGDGQLVAFISERNGIPDLYLYDLRRKRLTEPSDLPGLNNRVPKQSPSLSSDGRTLAFVSQGNIYLYDLRRQKLLNAEGLPGLNSPAVESSPTLSADGRYVAFVSNRQGNSDVYVYDRGPVWLRWVSR
ncbi:CHAT domain-containing protein [Leptolyngbya sp. FACHB-261]|uniref:CHAT domain-containing protein n=1 Tax=Leptolyngbya sp. FACHB-261 TaxID=2692806 RepID=UPI001682AB47|nr:CHAT domain-containing protein [Leptolyngbya sp. FACHB-261]MBD2101867.1 PD40 domain-containing protein [Leptolyngbya sp. FACHB-261]